MPFPSDAPVHALNAELKAADPALIGNEALLAAVLAGSGDCIKILDLDGRLQFMSEGGKRVMEVENFSLLKGCAWPDLWTGEGNPAARRAVADARNGIAAHFQGDANTAKGNPRYWDVRVMPILGPDNEPTHLLSISTDITQQRVAELALRESELQARLALAAAQMGVWQCQLIDGQFVNLQGDDRAIALLGGVPGEAATFETFASRIDPADRLKLRPSVAEALGPQGDGIVDIEYRILPKGDDAERWVHARAQALPTPEGYRLVGTVRDISHRKSAEAQQRLLAGELQHRIKNSLAMVNAIAVQTLRGDDIAERRTTFSARLAALAQAQDLLTAQTWKSAPVRSVVDSALTPHLSFDRFIVHGPEVNLNARQALSLSLTIHELATNAAKYGAMSRQGGQVEISWGVGLNGEDESQFSFRWQESGGPVVSPPDRTGFGTRMITRVLAADFDGIVRIEYEPDGVVCTLASPVSSVVADNPALTEPMKATQ